MTAQSLHLAARGAAGVDALQKAAGSPRLQISRRRSDLERARGLLLRAPARCREVQLADDVLELDRVAEGARDPLDLARRIAGGVGEVWLAA
jgi:hypothetical protein